jgi:KOW motif
LIALAKAASQDSSLSKEVLTIIRHDGFEFTVLLNGTFRIRPIPAPQIDAGEDPYEKYNRIVDQYNHECNRLAEVRAEIDRLASQLQVQQHKSLIDVRIGDRVRIKDGPFENFEGTVGEIFEERGLIKVFLIIFNKKTAVDLKFWQFELLSSSPEAQLGAEASEAKRTP